MVGGEGGGGAEAGCGWAGGGKASRQVDDWDLFTEQRQELWFCLEPTHRAGDRPGGVQRYPLGVV